MGVERENQQKNIRVIVIMVGLALMQLGAVEVLKLAIRRRKV